jgi:hypothetical protein
MYVNGKMRPVETIPGIGGEVIKRFMWGVNSTMIYLIYCKNFCKCHNNKNKKKRNKKSKLNSAEGRK